MRCEVRSFLTFFLSIIAIFNSLQAEENLSQEKYQPFISSLKANGDINFWDEEIAKEAAKESNPKKVILLFERGENPLKIINIDLPSYFFENEFFDLCSKYISISIHNFIVCEGAKNVIIFMDDKANESLLTKAVINKMTLAYPRLPIYGNFGDPITIQDSSSFSLSLTKELRNIPSVSFSYPSDGYLVGIDVGGSSIKTVVMEKNKLLHFFSTPVCKDKGGEPLAKQILECLSKAEEWVKEKSSKIISVGLTFPAPVKINIDGSSKVIRLTNFERFWEKARGNKLFDEDYLALNNIADEIKKRGVEHVAILNDADAFGFGEACSSFWKEGENALNGIKVILPIGSGPGYSKICQGKIEPIPNQGGHMILDLSESACTDPGCEHQGCYGGYVPASAIALRAKKLGLGIVDRNETMVPSDLNDSLSLLVDIASWIGKEALKLQKITGCHRVILSGGICQGWTGKELVRFANEFIKEKYPQYSERLTIELSSFDIVYGGAIGAAQYAISTCLGPKEKWNDNFQFPQTSIGKGLIDPFFKNILKKKVALVTTRQLADYFASKNYSWFQNFQRDGRIFLLEDHLNPENLIEKIQNQGYEELIAIGGGTLTDCTKYIASKLNLFLTAIPSALTGTAMFTEKAIFYQGKGVSRERISLFSSPPKRVIVDVDFLQDFKSMNLSPKLTFDRVQRSGAGDLVTIYPALCDWKLANSENKEKIDPIIYCRAKQVLSLLENNAEQIRKISDLGLTIIAESLAEGSFLNMRYGVSRPKDGSEHLVGDEIDRRLPIDQPRLHGEVVALCSIIMGYLYSSEYNPKAFFKIRNLVHDLGLPTHPKEIGISKELIIDALQHVGTRADKYTYFDKFKEKMTYEFAELIYDRIFGKKSDEIEEFVLDISLYVNNSVKAMGEHLQKNVVNNISAKKTKSLVDALMDTKKRNGRVIINAAGRIGEVGVFFQQKLRALGFCVDDFKEITPEFLVGKDDLILTLSGSGKTSSIINNLKNIDLLHRRNVLDRPMFSITANPTSSIWSIGSSYHNIILIPGRSKEDCGNTSSEIAQFLPLSSTFEYSTLLYLEGVIEVLTRHPENLDEKQIDTIVHEVILDTTFNSQKELKESLHRNESITARFVTLLMSSLKKENDNSSLDAKRRIYLFGLGQNNYVVRLFARRMQNIGFDVYVPGPRDIVSKPRKNDIAIFVSNSGARPQMEKKMIVAKDIGCSTVLITAAPHSPLASITDLVIPISRRSSVSHTADIMIDNPDCCIERDMKRSFEVASMFYLEGISVSLMKLLQVEEMELKHIPKEFE